MGREGRGRDAGALLPNGAGMSKLYGCLVLFQRVSGLGQNCKGHLPVCCFASLSETCRVYWCRKITPPLVRSFVVCLD